jgi:hypothetical protein
MWQRVSFRFIDEVIPSHRVGVRRLATDSEIALYCLLSSVSERVLDRLRQVAAFHNTVDEERLTVRS